MSKRKTSAFDFEDGGRRYSCRVEAPRAGMDAWWWFDVTGERNERHAPFRAEATDTTDAIQARVVAYYDDLLARRAAPAQGRWHQRGRPAAAAGAPAADPAPTT